MLLIWNLGNFGRGVHSLQNCKAICVNDVSGYAICSCLKLLRGPFILYKYCFSTLHKQMERMLAKGWNKQIKGFVPLQRNNGEKKIKQKTINQTL